MIDLPPAEVRCLETAIHYEAKGESAAGKVAVGNVVLNRVAAANFPKSVCAVVKQKKQFSWYKGNDNLFNSETSSSTKLAAQKAMKTPRNHVLFFHATYVFPAWSKKLSKQYSIGKHVFYALN
ncbi:MAG: cell wall hydrolase [Arenimonas sp.]|nr:cell wall hydrolase [Arenimonas sp.]MBP6310367.1 cell wall hydrolase [Arenimonas sp.]